MRRHFIQTLCSLAATDDRIALLTGDLGYSVLEPFAEGYPDRFFNVGVAEQNMIGMATGLAEAGLIPFVFSIATFASLRPYEFIRNGPVAHRLPVRIIGVGGGFEYGVAGHTHHALEDLGVLRLLPGLTVLAPADHRQAAAALNATWDLPGPVYYRVGKNEDQTVRGLDGRFDLDRPLLVRQGSDLLLAVTGSVAGDCAMAAEDLEALGVSAAVLVVPVLNPAPVDELAKHLSHHRLVVSVESHYVVGGLGSLLSEVIAEHGLPCRLLRRGVGADTARSLGSEAYLRGLHGLSRNGIAAAAKAFFDGHRP